MKTLKMSLANIQGKLSRAEMKKVMAGSDTCQKSCTSSQDCQYTGGAGSNCTTCVNGHCGMNY